MKTKYKEIDGMFFSKDTDETFARFIVCAHLNKRRIFIRHNDGWEDFSGYHSKDGLTTFCYVGRSTGMIKIPLVISSKRSLGGCAMITSRQAVKTYGYNI